ncbi:hypothetical protein V6N13_139510 [Hibiscus sabdariffa]|uniref:Uncharacterized protein n=1 Tax=Hibiscus sabdariffa TaxID=183260 RepID=A0ABR2C7W6_9ROSI
MIRRIKFALGWNKLHILRDLFKRTVKSSSKNGLHGRDTEVIDILDESIPWKQIACTQQEMDNVCNSIRHRHYSEERKNELEGGDKAKHDRSTAESGGAIKEKDSTNCNNVENTAGVDGNSKKAEWW